MRLASQRREGVFSAADRDVSPAASVYRWVAASRARLLHGAGAVLVRLPYRSLVRNPVRHVARRGTAAPDFIPLIAVALGACSALRPDGVLPGSAAVTGGRAADWLAPLGRRITSAGQRHHRGCWRGPGAENFLLTTTLRCSEGLQRCWLMCGVEGTATERTARATGLHAASPAPQTQRRQHYWPGRRHRW